VARFIEGIKIQIANLFFLVTRPPHLCCWVICMILGKKWVGELHPYEQVLSLYPAWGSTTNSETQLSKAFVICFSRSCIMSSSIQYQCVLPFSINNCVIKAYHYMSSLVSILVYASSLAIDCVHHIKSE
jgi:hypothetical protein